MQTTLIIRNNIIHVILKPLMCESNYRKNKHHKVLTIRIVITIKHGKYCLILIDI
jgi:hypothetical protein